MDSVYNPVIKNQLLKQMRWLPECLKSKKYGKEKRENEPPN